MNSRAGMRGQSSRSKTATGFISCRFKRGRGRGAHAPWGRAERSYGWVTQERGVFLSFLKREAESNASWPVYTRQCLGRMREKSGT